jgi:hypothetical protein
MALLLRNIRLDVVVGAAVSVVAVLVDAWAQTPARR